MENKSNAFLSVRNVEKIYANGEKAVYNFNLDIERNEFIIIVGPSGCGKSTTLRMIAGLEDISSGDIFLENELLNYKPCKDRKMAIVFQSYALYPQMNVFNNIAFPLTINKYPAPAVNTVLRSCGEVRTVLESSDFAKLTEALSEIAGGKGKNSVKEERISSLLNVSLEGGKLVYKLYRASGTERGAEVAKEWLDKIAEIENAEKARIEEKGVKVNADFCELNADGTVKEALRKLTPFEIKKKVYETAEKLDLTDYLDKLPKELSGGQMQRVALGRAIIKNVPVFLMDEPLSNLDAKLRLTMRSEIVKLHNRIHATTIYVTHDQTEAMTMATRIVVMSRGFIQQIGTPEEVYNSPVNLFVAKFIGSPSMNLFDMNFDRDKRTLEYGDVKIPLTESFIKLHDGFYENKIDEFTAINGNFDDKAREYVLKIMSATGEGSSKKISKQKKGISAGITKLFGKSSVRQEEAEEKHIAAEKLDRLKGCLNGAHNLTVGIRPERIHVEKVRKGETYVNCLIVKPTVCELLGGEYNVHFDFCNKDMVAKVNAKTPVTVNDEIAVRFSVDDIYIFDPVTSDVIKEIS